MEEVGGGGWYMRANKKRSSNYAEAFMQCSPGHKRLRFFAIGSQMLALTLKTR